MHTAWWTGDTPDDHADAGWICLCWQSTLPKNSPGIEGRRAEASLSFSATCFITGSLTSISNQRRSSVLPSCSPWVATRTVVMTIYRPDVRIMHFTRSLNVYWRWSSSTTAGMLYWVTSTSILTSSPTLPQWNSQPRWTASVWSRWSNCPRTELVTHWTLSLSMWTSPPRCPSSFGPVFHRWSS